VKLKAVYQRWHEVRDRSYENFQGSAMGSFPLCATARITPPRDSSTTGLSTAHPRGLRRRASYLQPWYECLGCGPDTLGVRAIVHGLSQRPIEGTYPLSGYLPYIRRWGPNAVRSSTEPYWGHRHRVSRVATRETRNRKVVPVVSLK
jgi:hypothetical protein